MERAYAHWQDLYEHGGRDPFWSDGCNLNLVRNHIFYYKRMIEEDFPLYMAHELYQRPLPPEVDQHYMARADEIRKRAQQSLQIYLADPDYKYLVRHRDSLSPKAQKETSIAAVLGYTEGLRMAIERDDLVSMRRHESPERYLDSFKQCANKVRLALEDEVPNLFQLAVEGEDEGPVLSM